MGTPKVVNQRLKLSMIVHASDRGVRAISNQAENLAVSLSNKGKIPGKLADRDITRP